MARDAALANQFLENVTQVPDVTPPYVPQVEVLQSAAATTGERIVRAKVYDNAPYYINWYFRVELELTVDGCRLPGEFLMTASGNNIWRGEIPANLVGTVSYRVRAVDEAGNEGVSLPVVYGSTGSSGVAFGCESTSISTGLPPRVRGLSEALPGTDLYVAGEDLAPGAAYILALAGGKNPCFPLPGFAIINIADPIWLTIAGSADANGCTGYEFHLGDGTPSGAELHFQIFTVDPATNGDLLSSSRGVTITTGP